MRQELQVHLALGGSLFATKGVAAPEVEQVYTYAWQLCQHVGDPTQHFLALGGLWLYAFGADMPKACDLATQLLGLAQDTQEPAQLMAAHRAQGATLLFLRDFAGAHAHLEQARALYDPQQHRYHAFLSAADTGIACLANASWTLWLLGYPDQALTNSREAMAAARERAHPFSLVAYALRCSAVLHQFRREAKAAQEQAEAMIAAARAQGFLQWEALATIIRGWALVCQGQADEGLGQLHQGLDTWGKTGAEVPQSYHLALLAETYGLMGQPEAGLRTLEEALALVRKSGGRFYEAELHRLKGELLLPTLRGEGSRLSPMEGSREIIAEAGASGRGAIQHEVEACFQHALIVARQQQVKSLELRAAISLSRLWQLEGKAAEALQMLSQVYGWFTEGFETADLQEARVLLAELA